MTLREIKRTGELAQPSFAFVPRVVGSFSCDSLRPLQFSRWPFAPLRRHPRKSVYLRARGTMSVLKISARREKQSGKEKEKCTKRGNDFTKRNCARSERRKVTLRRSRRRKQQRRGRRRKQRRKIKMSTNSSSYLGENIFSSYAEESLFSEWERLIIES